MLIFRIYAYHQSITGSLLVSKQPFISTSSAILQWCHCQLLSQHKITHSIHEHLKFIFSNSSVKLGSSKNQSNPLLTFVIYKLRPLLRKSYDTIIPKTGFGKGKTIHKNLSWTSRKSEDQPNYKCSTKRISPGDRCQKHTQSSWSPRLSAPCLSYYSSAASLVHNHSSSEKKFKIRRRMNHQK